MKNETMSHNSCLFSGNKKLLFRHIFLISENKLFCMIDYDCAAVKGTDNLNKKEQVNKYTSKLIYQTNVSLSCTKIRNLIHNC